MVPGSLGTLGLRSGRGSPLIAASMMTGVSSARTGNLYFFRTKGGALSTTYGDAEEAFDWEPDYAPSLPPALQRYATFRFDGARNY